VGKINPKKVKSLFITAQSGTVKLKLQFRHGSVTEKFAKVVEFVESDSCCDPPTGRVTVALHSESVFVIRDTRVMLSSWKC